MHKAISLASQFQSDHGILTGPAMTFAQEGLTLFDPRGWAMVNGVSVANPVSHTKGMTVIAEIKHKVGPPGHLYDLLGGDPQNYLHFSKTGLTSQGEEWVILTLDSVFPLQNKIYYFNYHLQWSIVPYDGGLGWFVFDGMGHNYMYVTWSTPIDPGPTDKRMDWACRTANNSTTQEQAADAIWNAIGEPVDPPHEPFEKPFDWNADWKLLDGQVSGDCNNQARLMKRAMNILGIGATVEYIRASTTSPVTDLEQQFVNVEGRARPIWLVMDFDTGPGYDWNAFEACCVTAGKWYAIFPKYKANSAFEMYQSLPFQQYWIFTEGNRPPSDPLWRVESIYSDLYQNKKTKEVQNMNQRNLIYALIPLTSIFVLMPSLKEQEAKKIEGEHQLFVKTTEALLKKLSPQFDDFFCPKIATQPVAPERIPNEVRAHATSWIKTVLQEKYIPNNLNDWWVGFEGECADMMIARYIVNSTELQLIETGSTVSLVIRNPNFGLYQETKLKDLVKETIRNALSTYTNFPIAKLDSAEIEIGKSTLESGEALFDGAIMCECEGKPVEEWEWWHYITVATDGQCLFIRFNEHGNPQPKVKVAHSGVKIPRFLPK